MNLLYTSLLATFICLLTVTLSMSAQTGVMLHIFLSLIATGLLIVASAQALLIGYQHYFLKHPRAKSWLPFLPPIQTMESVLFNLLVGGTLLFTASLVSGFFYESDVTKAWLKPKILLAMGAWCVLGLLLVGRKIFGWRGQTAIRWTLSATLLVLLLLLL